MSVFEAAISLLAPPNCLVCGAEGTALCESCSSNHIQPFGERCWRCNKLSPESRTCPTCARTGSPSRVWVAADHAGAARDLLSLYKFGHQRAAAGPIASLMAGAFLSSPASKDYLVVPVPTATSRIRERGFGHTELLARQLSLRLRFDKAEALRRLGQGRQLGSKRDDRLVQLAGSFGVRNPRAVSGRDILLIDDVVTTGGTIIAAAKTLRAAGAKSVDALLFAKHL